MANRHKRFRRGGRASHGVVFAGAGSATHKAMKQGTGGFEVGGAVGSKPRATAVRRARGGSVFSSAASSLKGSGGHAGAPKRGGGRGKFALGGTVTPQLAKGGQVKTRRHGGKCEDDDDDEEEEDDDDEGHKRGGRAKHKAGGGDIGGPGEFPEGRRPYGGFPWQSNADTEPEKRGGRAKKKERMHYWAKGGRAEGGEIDPKGRHVDVYKTVGGTHHWHDDEHEDKLKARGGKARPA